MLLSYLFDDFTTKIDVSPDVIAFGSNRIAVKNIAAVRSPRRLRIWNALDAARIPINAIVFVLSLGASSYVAEMRNDQDAAFMVFGLLLISYMMIVMLIFYTFNIRARRDLILITAGGPVLVFNNISRSFSRRITRLLHDVIAGRETRRLQVDRRRRTISVIEAET
jgi:hypothetical protein